MKDSLATILSVRHCHLYILRAQSKIFYDQQRSTFEQNLPKNYLQKYGASPKGKKLSASLTKSSIKEITLNTPNNKPFIITEKQIREYTCSYRL